MTGLPDEKRAGKAIAQTIRKLSPGKGDVVVVTSQMTPLGAHTLREHLAAALAVEFGLIFLQPGETIDVLNKAGMIMLGWVAAERASLDIAITRRLAARLRQHMSRDAFATFAAEHPEDAEAVESWGHLA